MKELNDDYRKIVFEFGSCLVRRNFEQAHAMLSKELATSLSAGDLEEEYDNMIVHFDTEDAGVVFQAFEYVDTDAYGDWIYMPIEGDGELESVNVAVFEEDGKLVINEIEWGREGEE